MSGFTADFSGAEVRVSPNFGPRRGVSRADLRWDDTGPGRDLFIQRCGGCHALGDAGTTATVGPDLGKLRPAKAVVEQAIEKGGTGSGKMPPGLAKGEELTQIADYVAAAAGG